MNMKQVVWGLLASLLCMPAMAVEPWVPTDAEFASLPPFCKVKMKSAQGSPDYTAWEQTLGKDFLHTHHYCAGINFINRSYRARSSQDKRFNLNSARGELQYMVTHADPGYSLMPDVHLNLGVVYSLSNQAAQAITHFNKAIELNPRQPRAYNALADYYAKTSQTTKALETVTEGLRHNPDTRSLQRRYTELGGKLPYPAPIEPPQQAASPQEAAPPAVPEAAPAPTVKAPEMRDTPVPAEAVPAPAIGSPTNPYCRFCPD